MLILINVNNLYFKGFNLNGSPSFTALNEEALNLDDLNEEETSTKIIYGMLQVWYDVTELSQTGLKHKTINSHSFF